MSRTSHTFTELVFVEHSNSPAVKGILLKRGKIGLSHFDVADE